MWIFFFSRLCLNNDLLYDNILGRDTTAQELAWMMYNVMVNPNVEGKLVEEVNSLLSEDNPIPKYDDIKQFEYTQATFYETLRLHPAVPISIKVGKRS